MIRDGKYTVETFAKERNVTRETALNYLSKLKREGYVHTSGGGTQKRIYTLSNKPQKPTNGFYDIVNKYSPQKLVPAFKHYVVGRYTIERAIIDGISIGDVRTLEATQHLFRHVTNWKLLFALAKKHQHTESLYNLYGRAKKTTRVRRMPKRYVR